jgi:plastocyanin
MRKVLIVMAFGLLAAACGGGGGSNQPSASSSSSGSGAPSNCADLTSGQVFTLVTQNIQFHPKCFTARSSQSIKIVNKDSVEHNFTIPGTQVDVNIQPGQTFNGQSAGLAPGTYPFFCKFHKSSGMVGTVTVTSG